MKVLDIKPKRHNLLQINIWVTEAVVQRCFIEKVFLEISQNSPENTCARVSYLIKLQDPLLIISKVKRAAGIKVFAALGP